MKKLTTTVVMFLTAIVLVTPSAFAATATSGTLNVSALVSGTLSMTVTLRSGSSTGTILTSPVSFGTLQVFTNTSTGGQTLRSSTVGGGIGDIVAMIAANSHGLPYTITQTGTMTGLPAGACTVVPVYATQDNGGAAKPASATLGTAGTWVATGKTLYADTVGTALSTIQAHYSITDDNTAGATAAVPINQAAGTYNGTWVITVTA